MREFLQYAGYFRASRYGKYLLSFTNVFTMKPSQDVLYSLYKFDFELRLRQDKLKYPELTEYRKGGKRVSKKVPCWAAFSYFELGNIENIYMYLRSDLRKEVLLYGYSRGKYGKKITEQVDTWINGVRTLRNICAHHARVVGMQEAIVLPDLEDDVNILSNGEDLFSRLYALKKILRPKDSENMKKQLKSVIRRTKINIYKLNILPMDWEYKFDRIKYL